ncbi:MAG: IS1 family transposase [Deltaproteobacteria bacterium]|nr:IS1 family transposase [Deltaproteobacteria bacterium]
MDSKITVCPLCPKDEQHVVKHGFFKRKTGHKFQIRRYLCKSCKLTFSAQTGSLTYRERKPHLTQFVMRGMMEGMSQRSCARLLGCRRATIAKKICRLGSRAALHLQSRRPPDIASGRENTIIFDEMETFEHTKCKPISIAIAVTSTTREILSVDATTMAASGRLAKIARKRYGKRHDHRRHSMRKVLSEVARLCPTVKTLKSDKCTRYPVMVRDIFRGKATHTTYKGRRGCVVGQGELKRGARDPLFPLNHTCAMFRDRIKRLARKTWCTTKKIVNLQHLLNLYAWWHNNLVKKTPRPFHMD